MKEDSIEELRKKLADAEAKNVRLQREITEFIRAEQVMVAAGLISEDKVKQAHEIVQTFNS